MKLEPFEEGFDVMKYFEMLPDGAPSKLLFEEMKTLTGDARLFLQKQLRDRIRPGAIDVNIMTKIDNPEFAKDNTPLPPEYSDALSALRGFALCGLSASVIFSAGMNPRLFAYLETFNDFYPDRQGHLKKKIVLKVSDYRSALIQGKYLAKKGLWVSEFRIESGLNCGGHAFPTEGYLMGPILEEFREKRDGMTTELAAICNAALIEKNLPTLGPAELKVTVQGGIGTAREDRFLREHYGVNGTGWGSPFLLVPEATNVDYDTLMGLISAKKSDYFLSNASPLGVPFNNFRRSSSETQRKKRISNDRPGSPCYKKFLAFNTEFTETPICVASRQYQDLKLSELASQNLPEAEYLEKAKDVTDKDCLCEGLTTPALIVNNIPNKHKLDAVTICPGPNLAYFSGIFSLKEMAGHIYGRNNCLNSRYRPHMFVNELGMYSDYLAGEYHRSAHAATPKHAKYLTAFKANLLSGIEYYRNLLKDAGDWAHELRSRFNTEIDAIALQIQSLSLPGVA
jgi:hypothetical protein